MEKVNVFILAAGLGERLRPITDHIPKPLLPVLGKPILERILEQISSLPLNHIGMNLHYKGKLIQDWLLTTSYAEKIQLFYEDPLLGTGGALKNAGSLLNESVFLVHNSDILSSLRLDTLVEQHISSGTIATLAIHDNKQFNTVWIDRDGLLQCIGKKTSRTHRGFRQVAFTGIAVYSPEFLNFLPEGNSSVVNAWLSATSSGNKINTVDFTGCAWSDIGSPEAYASTVFEMLRNKGETVYIHHSINCRNIELNGNAVIEKDCLFYGSSSLRDCIILPGSEIKDNAHLERVIVGPEYKIALKKSHIMLNRKKLENQPKKLLVQSTVPISDNAEVTLIGMGGSDRRFYRLRDKQNSLVLMECSATDPDYNRQIAYTQFFRKYSVPVPELIDNSADNSSPISNKRGKKRFIYTLFEDLGDLSLYSWLQCVREPEMIETMYRLVLDILINLHTTVTRNSTECPLLQSRIFDYEHFRWETSYFIERFVTGTKGVQIKEKKKLEKEFDSLALRVDSFRKTVVHRDFQSQNIIVTKGHIPRIVDYQGARIGPPAYDLASFLWDPYFRIEDDLRERLLNYYIEKMNKSSDNTMFDETEFRETLLPCRLQRHMQALGAYGFLSKEKCKTYFLKYVPQAVQYLNEETELVRNEYPLVYSLVKELS